MKLQQMIRSCVSSVQIVCAALVTVGCVAQGVVAQTTPTRSIQVTVRVKDNVGIAIAGVPVGAGPSTSGMLGKTELDGSVVLSGHVSNATTQMWVGLSPISPASTAEQSTIDAARFSSVIRSLAFKQYVSLVLTAEVNEYEVILTGLPASTISGRVVDGQAAPVNALVCRRDGLEFVQSDKVTGAYSLGGIAKLQAGEVFALDPASGRVVAQALTPEQATAGGAMGDIVMPVIVGVDVNINVTGREALPGKFTNRASSVSLIGMSGTLYSFAVKKNGEVRLNRNGTALPRVPEGTYYVAPGGIGENRTANALIDAVRASRFTELDAAGVPKLVVTASGGTLSINAASVENAIFSLGGEK